ncbi:MAG: PIG-L family deacetylase [Ekhidna sp.]|nr:PIG-L family deacetylase [Ekhidna sp.]
MYKITLLSATLIVLVFSSYSQYINTYQLGAIRQNLEKLNVLGTVLYVAAHPDDENTRMITYYANEELMRTGYLSATRGDGGQNLIGPEIREQLGVIRTQELLAARRKDGGQQFFSRANDFGYSKNPEETFTIWDRDKVLSDFVWVFRNFRPDIIITRFNSDGVSHGHHTASAILAREAFELAGNPAAFPEQLDLVDTWKPKKIFWNTGRWWFRNPKRDTVGLTSINMGEFNPLIGASYGEVAALSRSMHKSQGFGSSGSRGDQVEYLKQWGGTTTKRPFDDIDTSWGRVNGSESVEFYIKKAIDEFDETKPWLITEYLVLAKKELKKLEDEFWKEVKSKELDELVIAVTGLYLSFSSEDDYYVPGDSIKIDLEAVNRSDVDIEIQEVKFQKWKDPVEFGIKLLNNKKFTSKLNLKLSSDLEFSTPYWLAEQGTLGMYTVEDQTIIGKPENENPLIGIVTLSVGGEELQVQVPVKFRRTDPVGGEVVQPISIGPPVILNLKEKVMVFSDDETKQVELSVIAGKRDIAGRVTLHLPEGWRSDPSDQSFDLMREGEGQKFSFSIAPPKGGSEGFLKVKAEVDGKIYAKGRVHIDYDHIPGQVIYPESKVKLVRLDLKRKKELIGYIEGAGDAIPQNLEQVGYKVEMLSGEDVEANQLSKYDAVILGVRAFNTIEWLAFKNEELFKYVENGGNLIVQYNTNRRLVTDRVAPFDLQISRDRVSVEKAPVEILAPKHPVLNSPNKIVQKDFDNWVQERGLYFPDKWSDEFTPVLSSNDPGESPKNGGLLVARYGKGNYVYSGYSWFRELPAGVPGAYRIFVNLIELEQ